VLAWTVQMISVPPDARFTHLVSGRRASASAIESALPGVVCSRTNQSTHPTRAPFTTPRTRRPADSLSLWYRRAAVWSEIPVTSAMVRNDALGSTVRTWTICRSISSSMIVSTLKRLADVEIRHNEPHSWMPGVSLAQHGDRRPPRVRFMEES